MSILRISILVVLLAGGAYFLWRIAPAKSRLQILQPEAHFPVVSGYNLNRQEFEFPRDFAGKFNLVIVPFQQYQQRVVNTWVPFAQEVEAAFPGFIYYELPTIYEMPVLSRTFINEGMRAGIPDQTSREREKPTAAPRRGPPSPARAPNTTGGTPSGYRPEGWFESASRTPRAYRLPAAYPPPT